MAQFTIKQGDTRPTFEYRLRRDGRPIDVRDAESIQFQVADKSTGELYISGEATADDGANGEVSYTLGPNDGLPIGTFEAEFEIIWDSANDATQTVPNDGYIEIVVNEPLGELDPTEVTDPDVSVTTIYTDNVAANTGSHVSLQNPVDAGTNDIENVGALDANSASVSSAPAADTDVARKAETDPLEEKTSGLSADGTEADLDVLSATNVNDVQYASPSDDGAGIQAALDAVGNGGTVKLRSGEYTVSSTINLDDLTDVTITADENDIVVRAAAGLDTQIFNNVNNNPVVNVTFEGFEIDGNAANQDLANATNYYGIGGLTDSERITIRNMTFREVANNAIVLDDGDNHRVINSKFVDTGHPDATKTANHVTINSGSGHVIRDNEFGRATDNAVFPRNSGTVISGNRFNEVFIYAMGSGSENIWFVNNEIVGTPTNPVDGSVQGGRFIRFEQGDLKNIHIRNNTLHGLTTDYGNFVEGTADVTGLEDIYIVGNVIDGGGYLANGIRWNDDVVNLTVDQNIIGYTQDNGIVVNGAVNGSISNNLIYNTNTSGSDFRRGIFVNQNNATPTENVTVAENKIIDDRATTLHYKGLMVALEAGSWITVRDNIVRGATLEERDVDLGVTNLIYNGLGYNDGDPGTGGQWNGEGFEGLRVFDTTNSVMYEYANGAWR